MFFENVLNITYTHHKLQGYNPYFCLEEMACSLLRWLEDLKWLMSCSFVSKVRLLLGQNSFN